MVTGVLVGRSSAATIDGIGSGHLKSYSVTGGVTLVDSSGIGISGSGFSGAPFRDYAITFSEGSFQYNGMNSGSLPTPGASTTATGDGISFEGIVQGASSSASVDDLVYVTISGVAGNV